MTERDVRNLLAVCDAADDQDTGTLDAFREAATVSVVAELARVWLAAQRVLGYAAQHHLRGSAAMVSDELLDGLRLAGDA